MEIDGVQVTMDSEISVEEARCYIEHAQEKAGAIKNIDIRIGEDGYIDLEYETEHVPFERIRRITGYLVGTLDRFNNGKRAEEHDRVKHGLEVEE